MDEEDRLSATAQSGQVKVAPILSLYAEVEAILSRPCLPQYYVPAGLGSVFRQNVTRTIPQTQVQDFVAPDVARAHSSLCPRYSVPMDKPALAALPGQVDQQAGCWLLCHHCLHQGPARPYSPEQGATQPARPSPRAQQSVMPANLRQPASGDQKRPQLA